MQNASAAKAKADAIIDNLILLATAYNEPLSTDRIEVYTHALADLSPEELQHGFNRALRETKWWPKPSELLEYCTGHVSAMADKLTIDEAWTWTVNYIQLFGIPAASRWELQGYEYHGATFTMGLRAAEQLGRTLAVTAPYYEATFIRVPPVPELINQTLTSMAGGPRMALIRISDGMRGWNSAEMTKTSGKDAGFIRKDWDEYCSRAIAASRTNRPATITSAWQLTGEVAPVFPPFTQRRIAVRVERGDGKYRARRLNREEATSLFGAGKLPAHLYEETLQYHAEVERKEKLFDTPAEFNAVFLGSYESIHMSKAKPPWPPMGRFSVETGDGRTIVFDDLTMAIGSLKLKPGQVVRFTATLKELEFRLNPRQFFDIGKAVITTTGDTI